MILRHQGTISHIFFFFFLSCYLPTIAAQEDNDFNCVFDIDSAKFDLSLLNTEQTAGRTRTTPPTTMQDSVRFNVCDVLKKQDGAEGDQCPEGTRACLTTTNSKQDEWQDRIITVTPVAQAGYLDTTVSTLSSPGGVTILMHGPSYPDNSDDSKKQSFKLNLLCNSEEVTPKFLSYDGLQVEVEWTHPAACPLNAGGGGGDNGNGNEDNGGNDDKKESRGSGIGWFFLVLLLAFLSYFGLGAYHRYTTYGATGKDLIPHREFWQEVPYMLSDVVSHMCSSVRPRRTSTRGGYIAV